MGMFIIIPLWYGHVYNNTPLIWVCLAKNNMENVRILFTYGWYSINRMQVPRRLFISHPFFVSTEGRRLASNPSTFDFSTSDQAWNQPSHFGRYGSDINFRTIYNDNALHFAARYADSEIIEFLIMHNISVNIFKDGNDTPLAWACSAKGNIENV